MTNSSELILVLGGTGKTGSRVTKRLQAAGRPVRSVSRSTDPGFDWYDATTWDAALAGATAVYIPPLDAPFPIEDFVKRAVRTGVTRFVALSGRRMQVLDPAGVSPMRRTENAVRESGVEWTILQANNFNQNFSEGDYREAVLAGELSLPLGDTPEPLIDAEDIAEAAVAALTADGHAGRLYELSGPRPVTMTQAVAAIAAATGKPVTFRDVDPKQHKDELREAGLPTELIEFLDAMYGVMRTGAIADVSGDVREILGRDPVDFDTWAKSQAGAWS